VVIVDAVAIAALMKPPKVCRPGAERYYREIGVPK
jgi:hypothetical protein